MFSKLSISGNDSHVDADVGTSRGFAKKISHYDPWQNSFPMRCRTGDSNAILIIGDSDYPFPIPLVEQKPIVTSR
jgi:hypothetical protein